MTPMSVTTIRALVIMPFWVGINRIYLYRVTSFLQRPAAGEWYMARAAGKRYRIAAIVHMDSRAAAAEACMAGESCAALTVWLEEVHLAFAMDAEGSARGYVSPQEEWLISDERQFEEVA